MSVYADVVGYEPDDMAKIADEIKEKLRQNGSLCVVLNDGRILTGICSIAIWGNGLYYGRRVGQRSFSRSVDMRDIVKVETN